MLTPAMLTPAMLTPDLLAPTFIGFALSAALFHGSRLVLRKTRNGFWRVDTPKSRPALTEQSPIHICVLSP